MNRLLVRTAFSRARLQQVQGGEQEDTAAGGLTAKLVAPSPPRGKAPATNAGPDADEGGTDDDELVE